MQSFQWRMSRVSSSNCPCGSHSPTLLKGTATLTHPSKKTLYLAPQTPWLVATTRTRLNDKGDPPYLLLTELEHTTPRCNCPFPPARRHPLSCQASCSLSRLAQPKTRVTSCPQGKQRVSRTASCTTASNPSKQQRPQVACS